ncbi:MAG: glutamate synthase subunit alpha, partial [Propionibacteriaceae bacterium]|jgi:glutamate synthase (NADPH/NADH) large chain|nr:glutamate synthase subunit alpha [Propionibacteriaceae bacterium]
LLGAEEYGFATAPLVVSGCVMMRVCHLDTCPVGVATQNPELREKYSGNADYLVNFFEFIAEEVRELLAQLGFRSLDEAIGHVEVLQTRQAVEHWKAHGLDLSPILHRVELPEGASLRRSIVQDHGLADKLDAQLVELAQPALASGELVRAELRVRNVDRTVGTILGHEITKATGGKGLAENTVDLTFRGTAGQSFGAFIPRGETLRLIGDANDYLGKGLSGGRIIVRPHPKAPFKAEDQVIAGNVLGYGATSGEIFLRGRVGVRFCVRNSGATAVVEGVGDHACEYMTGGEVLILGLTGRNLAAGMSGGIAWVLDLDPLRLNSEMVAAQTVSDADFERILALLRKHLDETGSQVAESLLESPLAELRERFTTLMPRDYARVMKAQADAEAAGLSPEEVTKQMMEATHG